MRATRRWPNCARENFRRRMLSAASRPAGRRRSCSRALEEARRVGAGTILLSCNPRRALRVPVDVAIDLPTGPELVTGSTRLKAGTATKLVLNMLSTIAMVRLGRVSDNLMINVQATNDKLRARAVRLVQGLSTATAAQAQAVLEANAWRVPESLAALKRRSPKTRRPQNSESYAYRRHLH